MENYDESDGLFEISGYGFKVASFNIEGKDGKNKGKHFVAKPLNSIYSNDAHFKARAFVSIILPNGLQQPFKLTYNKENKCLKWYPFFGVAPTIIKDGIPFTPFSKGLDADEQRYYDNDVLKGISQVLDKYTKMGIHLTKVNKYAIIKV